MATREVVAKLPVFICNHMGVFARSKRAGSLPEIRRKILGTVVDLVVRHSTETRGRGMARACVQGSGTFPLPNRPRGPGLVASLLSPITTILLRVIIWLRVIIQRSFHSRGLDWRTTTHHHSKKFSVHNLFFVL